MLPSNTYTKRSALCRCGWEASPGAKSTVSTMPSFPGTSGRSLVIRRVTFPTGNASTLPNASTLLNASNRDNTSLFIFYSFQRGLPLGFVLFDFERVTIRIVAFGGKAYSDQPLVVRLLIYLPARTIAETSAFGGKAVIDWCCGDSPLLTQSGHRL